MFDSLRLSIVVLTEVLLEVFVDVTADIAAELLKELEVLLMAIHCWHSLKS